MNTAADVVAAAAWEGSVPAWVLREIEERLAASQSWAGVYDLVKRVHRFVADRIPDPLDDVFLSDTNCIDGLALLALALPKQRHDDILYGCRDQILEAARGGLKLGGLKRNAMRQFQMDIVRPPGNRSTSVRAQIFQIVTSIRAAAKEGAAMDSSAAAGGPVGSSSSSEGRAVDFVAHLHDVAKAAHIKRFGQAAKKQDAALAAAAAAAASARDQASAKVKGGGNGVLKKHDKKKLKGKKAAGKGDEKVTGDQAAAPSSTIEDRGRITASQAKPFLAQTAAAAPSNPPKQAAATALQSVGPAHAAKTRRLDAAAKAAIKSAPGASPPPATASVPSPSVPPPQPPAAAAAATAPPDEPLTSIEASNFADATALSVAVVESILNTVSVGSNGKVVDELELLDRQMAAQLAAARLLSHSPQQLSAAIESQRQRASASGGAQRGSKPASSGRPAIGNAAECLQQFHAALCVAGEVEEPVILGMLSTAIAMVTPDAMARLREDVEGHLREYRPPAGLGAGVLL